MSNFWLVIMFWEIKMLSVRLKKMVQCRSKQTIILIRKHALFNSLYFPFKS